MKHREFEELFAKTYSHSGCSYLEMALHGGSYHFIEIKDNVISEVKTQENTSISVRGIYQKNPFYFNTPVLNSLNDQLKINCNIIQKVPNYPFQENANYKKKSKGIDFNNFNNLLLLQEVFPLLFKLFENNYNVSGFFYIRNTRVSPKNSIFNPINAIINNKGLNLWHEQTQIIIELHIKKEDFQYKISNAFEAPKQLKNFLREKQNYIEIINNFKKIKQSNLNIKKIILSSKSVAYLLLILRPYFLINLQKNSNFWQNSQNKRIFSHKITINETLNHELLSTINFDELGILKKRNILIKKGVLSGYIASFKEAEKYKVKPTANNLLLKDEAMPFSLHLEGNNNINLIKKNDSITLYCENLIIKNIENLKNIDSVLNFVSKNAILYQKRKVTNIIPEYNFSISLKDLFMHIESLGKEQENMGMIAPEILINL